MQQGVACRGPGNPDGRSLLCVVTMGNCAIPKEQFVDNRRIDVLASEGLNLRG